MKLTLILMLLASSAMAQVKFNELSAEDQQYYKNDIMQGNNTRERIDSTVKEINKLHGEIASLKSELAALKKEVEDMKSKK